MKQLFIDIEISPSLAAVWGLWGQDINLDRLLNDSEVLSWAAKWRGEEEVWYSSLGMTSKKKMLREIYEMMDDADVIVHYNGDRFDIKILNMEFMLQGWPPPGSYKSLDMLKVMKKQFRGTSNKMDYWLKKLGLQPKVKHRGFSLWVDCMNKVPGAFEELEEYNIGDIPTLESLYDRVLPWIHNHPNRSVFDEKLCCPTCGSAKYQSRGVYVTQAGKYNRFSCTECGKWFRGSKQIGAKEKFIGV